jgi:hypothetical protein
MRKGKIMKALNRLLPGLLAGFSLAGCTTYESTVSAAEPHGVVRFVRAAESSFDSRAVEKLDGLPVRRNREYRVAPGRHEMVVRVTETRVESYQPVTVFGSGAAAGNPVPVNMSPSGQMAVTGTQPFGAQQSVNFNVAARESSAVTNVLTVEAGWLYEFDGYGTVKVRLPQ